MQSSGCVLFVTKIDIVVIVLIVRVVMLILCKDRYCKDERDSYGGKRGLFQERKDYSRSCTCSKTYKSQELVLCQKTECQRNYSTHGSNKKTDQDVHCISLKNIYSIFYRKIVFLSIRIMQKISKNEIILKQIKHLL